MDLHILGPFCLSFSWIFGASQPGNARNTIIIIAHTQEAGMSTRVFRISEDLNTSKDLIQGATPDANGSHLTGFSSWNEEAPEMNRAARLYDPGHGFGSSTCDMS
ncbi:unnamed protein product [Clonostachys byssicola]|uniref:Uncharacterized protein n=1 Tax=Clonostachys byssicola TaxID=160290 RepID=A0A9N9XY91_9HYPO|nr:unnamed protein product [Clonostachys byssicola]